MKIIIALGLLILATTNTFASDFQINAGEAKTISVIGCDSNEVGKVERTLKMNGEHTLQASCVPIYCIYTNESKFPFNYHTKWTIYLRGQSNDYGGVNDPTESTAAYGSTPSFGFRDLVVLNTGVPTPKERDVLINQYIAEKRCKLSPYVEQSNTL